MATRHLPPFATPRSPEGLAAEQVYNISVGLRAEPDEDALRAMVAEHLARYPSGVDAAHARRARAR
jgi:hypothetical protein